MHVATRARSTAITTLALALAGCSGSAPASATQAATPAAPVQPTSVGTEEPRPSPTRTAEPTPRPSPTLDPIAAGYADLPGWIVFEHFGARPDGTSAALDFHNRMIWMVHADGSQLHELAPGHPGDGKSSPDISADGRTVAFSSWDPVRLVYTVPIEGGEVVQISRNCDGRDDCREFDPAWSPDGAYLVFVRNQRADDGTVWSQIGMRDIATGELTLLDETKVNEAAQYLSQPSWSPDGEAIAYQRTDWTATADHPSTTRVLVVNADGSDLHELPTPPSGWAADPDWSPEGSMIVFSQSPERETQGWAEEDGAPPGGIYTVRPDGTELKRACGECLGGGSAPSFTSDGRIFFWGFRTFALMDADGGNSAHINAPELTWFGDELGFGYVGRLQPTE